VLIEQHSKAYNACSQRWNFSMRSSSSAIDWNDVIKKEARGSNDEDLGEVQERINQQRQVLHSKRYG
jgi:hypothetical protein